jgi:Thaumarchaeal output domain 1
VTSKDRQSLYEDPSVQLLLNRFVKGEIMELVPTFDPSQTVRYPEVENVMDGDPAAARQLVEKLWDVGIFKRKFFEKVLVCPSCLSPNVSNDYVCPNCNSIDIERKTLLEHTACGTIDSVDNFLVAGGLACPKCNVELMEAGIDYQKLGSWFQCEQCNKRSDMPSPIHRCRSCGHIFTIKETGFEKIYSYRLSSEAEEEFKRSFVLMKPIGDALEEFQFQVQMPGQLPGRSGVLHRFDAVASKSSGDLVVIDLIASENPIDEEPVAALYAKIFDVTPTQAILITIPSAIEKAKRLASLYRIVIIEASNPETAADQMKEKFGWTGLQGPDDQPADLQL